MPEGDRKEAQAYGDGRANFGQVKRKSGWEMIGKVGKDAQAEQQGQDKNAQFNQSGGQVEEYLNLASGAKEYGANDIEEKQEARDPQRHRYKGMR